MRKTDSRVLTLVAHGRPSSLIVLGRKATPTEKHAADELKRYVERTSGARLPVVQDGETTTRPGQTVILIGRPETNPRILELVLQGALKLSGDYPGGDGFVIHTAGNKLVLGGSRDRGTLYAVYHLLEKFLHVGFFSDGDQVPKTRNIALPRINLPEKPRFSLRFSFHGGCAAGYSFGSLWGFEEWKTELDWLAKNKFNAVIPSLGRPIVDKMVDERMGLPKREISKEDRESMRLARRVFGYMRTLDMDAITPLPGTNVTKEFQSRHPQGRYFRQGWTIPEGSAEKIALHPNIHPADPLYRKLVETFIHTWTEVYGTWHLYWGVDPGSEATFDTTPEERDEVLMGLPKGVMAGIQDADPEGIWIFNDWGWVFNFTCAWSKELIQGFLKNVRPSERALVWNNWIEWTARPIFEEARVDYYAGRPFALGFLNEFGGDDYLHGNLPKSLALVRDLDAVPKAAGCRGFGLVNEVLHYNVHYYDFLMRLAWQPQRIGYPSHLGDLALRRYGKQSLKESQKAIRVLADAVYRDWVTSSAMYQHRLYPHQQPMPNYPVRFMPMNWSVRTAQYLGRFIEMALSLPPAVRANPFLGHDLVDAFRQYATELFNVHFLGLDSAFSARDAARFDRHAAAMLFLLDHVERVLSSRPSCRVEDLARSLSRHRRNPRLDKMRETVRKNLSFATSYPSIIDYGSRDFYEQLKFYWRPRVEAFLKLMREKMILGARPTKEELDTLYRAIEVKWDERGYDPRQAPPYPGPMWRAVKAAFDAVRTHHAVRLRPTDIRVKAGPVDHLEIVSGNHQNGKVGEKLPAPLVIKLCDKDGNGVGGFMGTMDIVRGAGKLTSVVFTTDLDGLARGEYTPGNVPGRHTIRAQAIRGRNRVTFDFIIQPP
ncbi:MAG: alpha-N-acetylglucosaminidase C-terminal domain-containing protein [Planctomycetes bacterium]|nr:alpha-N-acetylglucosaminidase C-terminal domain-containing protein [Planctomycetota bacterium]